MKTKKKPTYDKNDVVKAENISAYNRYRLEQPKKSLVG